MTGELMIGIAEFNKCLQGAVSPEDISEARRILDGPVNNALQAIKYELKARMHEACPHKWKKDVTTHLAICVHCDRNNGLVRE